MRLFIFFKEVVDRVLKNDLIAYANELTFKLMLSVFPFLIFFLTIVAHLKIEYSEYVDYVLNDFPPDVAAVITAFLEETVYARHAGLMSVSLAIALYSASSGFHSLIKGINRAYGVREKRNFIFTRLISLFLMLMFMLTITLSIYILILRSQINQALVHLHILKALPSDTSAVVKLLMVIVITVVILLVYQLGANVRVKPLNIMPGTLFTLGGWFLLSRIFNIYINNYARYSAVYGSIGALFVSALWLNLLCVVLLVGCQGNAVLEDKAFLRDKLGIEEKPPRDKSAKKYDLSERTIDFEKLTRRRVKRAGKINGGERNGRKNKAAQ
ncbi:MAG: YihY/virulence factor BrkB family protein [Firmicutes bacterium]|nr:YihY/virulence factor BrkB family protein [Bacillota bacterium]